MLFVFQLHRLLDFHNPEDAGCVEILRGVNNEA